MESDIWESPELLQSPSLAIDEERVMESHCTRLTDKSQQSGKTFSYNLIKESPIKLNGNVLLSQGGFGTLASEPKDVDLFTLLKTEEPFISHNVRASKFNPSMISPAKFERVDLERKPSVSVKVEKSYSGQELSYMFNGMQNNEIELKDKPKLKLNIAVANSSRYQFGSVETPEVVKSLTDESTGFDLLSFVNGVSYFFFGKKY